MTRRLAVEPPGDLKPAAAARYKVVYRLLAARGAVDLELLRTYCQVWSRWREAEDGIAQAGQLTRGANGRPMKSPLLDVAAQANAQARDLEQRLGVGLAAGDGGEGGLVTRQDLAARLRCHPQTITHLVAQGMPVARRGSRGRAALYDEAAVRAWKDARDGAAQAPGHVDLVVERARKERAQAVLAEQTFQVRAGHLLPVADVERSWGAKVQAVRAAILATATTQADHLHRVAVLEGVAGLETALRDLAIELLRELSPADAGTEGEQP